MLMKSLLLSTGVVSIAVILNQSLPVTLDILTNLTNELPYLWSSFIHSWLQPPYLYLLINCIILSIVASSKLHPRGIASPSPEKSAVAVFDEAVKNQVVFGYVADVTAEREEVFAPSELHPRATVAPSPVNVDEVVKNEVVFGYVADDVAPLTAEREEITPFPAVETAEADKEETPAVAVAVEVELEKPRYSARFGNRKLIKGSPEAGKTMLKKVSRPKRQETLESTWRTLTEGRPMPLTRHLRKSDTFSGVQQEPASPPVHMIKKSETFSYGSGGDVESPSPGSARKLRREPSLSQDELNRRVEAFIRKFNEEMRLQQRQELFNQYQSGPTK
ncbi:uncharacterized protein LOC141656440 isoform X2 [Silene latifolia]|uniref:uncharacterized protein LOC141656440 isoform X2 n=1 Tax=Silene latifolia TaxID=37657 RepID=UPI003D76E147